MGGQVAPPINQHRSTAVTFLNWCVDKKRLGANPLGKRALKRLDEDEDRHRVRRALTDQELAWLLSIAPEHRRVIYQMAYWTGLRRSELGVITRADVDLGAMLYACAVV